MLINTTRQEERDIDSITSHSNGRSANIDKLIKIIERLDAAITEKDAMIKRLQQGHKVL